MASMAGRVRVSFRNSRPSATTGLTTAGRVRRGRSGGFPFTRCMTIRRRNSTGWRNAPRKASGRPSLTRWYYVIHVVPKAPMQRIIYEIYRDRAAFESHERQPHIQQFAADRASCVLATNIIDLRLKYAKVAALSAPRRPSRPHGSRRAGRRGHWRTAAARVHRSTRPAAGPATRRLTASTRRAAASSHVRSPPSTASSAGEGTVRRTTASTPPAASSTRPPARSTRNGGNGGYAAANGQYGAANGYVPVPPGTPVAQWLPGR